MTRAASASGSSREIVGFPWGALLAAVALRTAIVLLKGPVGTDEALYLVLGHNWWAGKGYTLLGAPQLLYPPLFPIVVGALERLLGSLEWASRLVFIAAGAALVPVAHAIARRALGGTAARWAAWLVAVSPTLTSYVASWFWGSMSEPLFLLLAYGGWLALLVGLGIGADEPPRAAPPWIGLAGLLFGGAYLTRPEGVAYAVLGALVLLWPAAWLAGGREGRPYERRREARRLGCAALLLAVFTAAAFPYVRYLHEHTGRWSLSAKSGTVLQMAFAMLGTDPLNRKKDLDVLAYEALGFSLRDDGASGARMGFGEEGAAGREPADTFLQVARRNPKFAALSVLVNAKDLLLTLPTRQVHPLPLAGLSVLGFVTAWRAGGERRRGAVLVALAGAPVGAFVVFGILPRFLVPVVPAALMLTAAAFEPLERWAHQRMARTDRSGEGFDVAFHATHLATVRILAPTVVAALALFGLAKSAKARVSQSEPVEYRTVGEWARDELPADAVIMCRKPEIAFYAQRPMVALAATDVRGLIDFARKRHVSHVILDRYAVWGVRPELRPLFEPTHVEPGLSLVRRFTVAGRDTLVLAVTPGG